LFLCIDANKEGPPPPAAATTTGAPATNAPACLGVGGTYSVFFIVDLPQFMIDGLGDSALASLYAFTTKAAQLSPQQCVTVFNAGVIDSSNPHSGTFVILAIHNVPNPSVTTTLLQSADLSILSWLSSSASLGGIKGVFNEHDETTEGNKEAPTTTTVATTATTTTQDYSAYLNQVLASINYDARQFDPQFLNAVVSGCQVNDEFCASLLNLLAQYIADLSTTDASNKEGSQMSTGTQQGGTALSTAQIAIICVSAVAFVAIVAAVILKKKTGSISFRRSSSRVSDVSDSGSMNRSLVHHHSRISVRAWPLAVEV